MHALYVANKYLPPNDYRVTYPARSEVCSVTFALPRRPEGIPPKYYVQVGFGEGFSLTSLKELLQLFFYLRKNRARFDFVHFNATILILFGPLIAFLAGVPSLITITGFGRSFTSLALKYRPLRLIYYFLLSISLRLSRGALFQNRADQCTVGKRFPAYRHKLFYIGSAMDLPVNGHKTFAASRLRVLLIARLLPDKGIADFLGVAERLHQAMDFVLVGPPSIGFDNLLRQVKACAVRGAIEYLGELEPPDVWKQLELAHILFFPSYGEGMSRVMLEAGFAGLCPVAYDIPANRDLISDGRGYLIPKRDTSEAIKILAQLSNDRQALMDNAGAYQKFVIENYHIEGYVRRMDEFLIKTFPESARAAARLLCEEKL